MKIPLNLSRAEVKLFCLSLDRNANTTKKVNLVDVTPTKLILLTSHQQSQAMATGICWFCKYNPLRSNIKYT